jgi:hypothetical protein
VTHLHDCQNKRVTPFAADSTATKIRQSALETLLRLPPSCRARYTTQPLKEDATRAASDKLITAEQVHQVVLA